MATPVLKIDRAETADLDELRERLKTASALGYYYVALLGLRTYEPLRIAATVRKGLAVSSIARLQRNSSLPAATIAEIAQISPRTLARRKKTGKLDPDESDRLMRVSRVIGRALELFEGNRTAASAWLSSAQAGLGGVAPLELSRTDVGAREVDNLIGRLEHGIPA